MNHLSIFFFLSFLYSLSILQINCYRSMRFNVINNENPNEIPENHISQELKDVDNISRQLVNNEKEEGEEDDEEDDDDNENEEKTSFDNIAHESIENIEGEAILDLENAEMENLLDNEIYRVVQDRIKKLWYIGYCRRDYTNLCPLGWNKSAYDNSLCIPPSTYQGQCRSMDFSDSKPIDKELFAWKCEVEWPCIKPPSLKVLEKCPIRWINVGNNLCIAPEDYNGECSPAIDFLNFDFEMRVRWAVLCNFEWPIDLEKKVLNKNKKNINSIGGPIEESGDVIKIVNTYIN